MANKNMWFSQLDAERNFFLKSGLKSTYEYVEGASEKKIVLQHQEQQQSCEPCSKAGCCGA